MSTQAISAALPIQTTPNAGTSKLQAKQAPAGSSATPKAAVAAAAPAASSATAAISAAAAALKEATETSAQTAKEAAGGDRTAQRLLAKQQSAAADRSGAVTSNNKAGATSAPAPGSIIDEHA